MYKVVDLFAGAGGLSLGFEQTKKFEVVVAIEKHPATRLTYSANHNHIPDVEVLDDILGVTNFDEFKEAYGQIDIIIGGPPCQGFSNANRQKFDLISQNNSLVKKYIEFIEQLEPKAFVMENVPMFKSDTHRFYISHEDNEEEFIGDIFEQNLILFKGHFSQGIDILKELGEKHDVRQYLMEDRLLKDLILMQKRILDDEKIKDLIEKRGLKLIVAIKNASNIQGSDSEEYNEYYKEIMLLLIQFIEGKISVSEVLVEMNNFIQVQLFFHNIQELRDNDIKYDGINLVLDKLEVKVKVITVFKYLMNKLGKGYRIIEGVLNAVEFGAPQTRRRFIAMGIRNDLVQKAKIEVKLPAPQFTADRYRTVHDAIGDLEREIPQYEVGLNAIPLVKIEQTKNPLLTILRDEDHLHNHVITKTREHILKRFKQLDQGQNFHDLDKDSVDTYTNPARTQNSIYKRLDYSAASPTVTNVRKSMWIHPTLHRAVSIREAARLQTFPDSFIFQGTKDDQYQQVGNAVPPILSKAIANQLLSILENTKM